MLLGCENQLGPVMLAIFAYLGLLHQLQSTLAIHLDQSQLQLVAVVQLVVIARKGLPKRWLVIQDFS
jgi:hypothetical protein